MDDHPTLPPISDSAPLHGAAVADPGPNSSAADLRGSAPASTTRDRRYTVVSLFSGAMGLDIGLHQTGRFDLLACVEKVPAFRATICRNRNRIQSATRPMIVYGEEHPEDGDLNMLTPERVLRDLGLQPGELDVLVGGPPCQSFSTTGKRGTVQDPRGTLLWRFLHFVDVLRPKFFLMENVRGLMSAALRHRPGAARPERGGRELARDEERGSVVRQFLHDLHDAYRVDCFEVNAVNYGAPQLRERALFIGNRFNRIVEFPAPTHGPPESDATQGQASLFADAPKASLMPFKTLGDALAGLTETDPVLLDFSPRKKRYLAMVPPGGNWRCLPSKVARESMGGAYEAKGGRSGWWRRLSMDLPCPTIVTMPNHAGTALCHPSEVRALSLRECARVQEFPDEWEFSGKTAEQYVQVGNAVPVRLGRVAGDLLAAHLDATIKGGLAMSAGEHPPYRIVYVKSHIRTRQWFKAGQQCIWEDGQDNDSVRYGDAKTERRAGVL